MVIGTTQWDPFVWKVSFGKTGDNNVFKLSADAIGGALTDENLFVLPLSDLDGVKVFEAVVKPPSSWEASCGTNVGDALWVTAANQHDALRAAVSTGFRCLQVAHLSKLLSYLKVTFPPGSRPTREADLVAALVRHINPTAVDADIIE